MNRGWQVNWTATAAQQMHGRLSTLQSSPGSDTAGHANSVNGGGGEEGGGGSGKDWEEPRRRLVDAVRFMRRHEGMLLLKAKGAGLAEVLRSILCILDQCVVSCTKMRAMPHPAI